MVRTPADEMLRRPATGYRNLCCAVKNRRGTIRLARDGDGWALVVTAPAGSAARQRAAGFFFGSIDEIDALAQTPKEPTVAALFSIAFVMRSSAMLASLRIERGLFPATPPPELALRMGTA